MGEVGEEVGYITTFKQQLCHAHFKSNRRPSSTPERQETREKKRQRLESRRLAKGGGREGQGHMAHPCSNPGHSLGQRTKEGESAHSPVRLLIFKPFGV